MLSSRLNQLTFLVVSCAVLSLGFVQPTSAAVISTQELINETVRVQDISQIESLLAREDVGKQLNQLGVSAESVLLRVNGMTDAEVAELRGSIDQQVAGGDALGVIGAVFLVLLILELVGVTDIFKAI